MTCITESKDGFSWYRGIPSTGFRGEAPYSEVIFDNETIRGTKISILVGKAFDGNIQKIKLLIEGNDEELSISENSRIFYAIYKAPRPSFEIIPIIGISDLFNLSIRGPKSCFVWRV